MSDRASRPTTVSIYQEMSEFAASCGAVNLAQGIPEALNDETIQSTFSRFVATSWQYTQVEGDADLRDAIASEYNGFYPAKTGIIVTAGCTEALLSALIAAHGMFGDRVIYLEPFYSYYPGLARIAGLRPEIVPLQLGGGRVEIDRKALENAFNSGARILLLNTPHNPTGWVLDHEAARLIETLAEAHDALVIIDEVYRDFVYVESAVTELHRLPGLIGRCLVANSVSKTFAATGMRVGWLAGPADLMARALNAHMHMSNCLPLAMQKAATHLFQINDRAWRNTVQAHYREKRDILLGALVARGFDCITPQGSHFIMADYSRLEEFLSPRDFALSMTRTDGVAPLPIDDFFSGEIPKLVRFSFGVSMDLVNKAAQQLCHRRI